MNFNQNRYSAIEVNLGSEKLPVNFDKRLGLRCTFFGERKNSCSSKFVQLLLLNRVKERWSGNRAAQVFHFINSFISNLFGPNSKTCTWEVRAAWGCVSRGFTVCTICHKFLSLDLGDPLYFLLTLVLKTPLLRSC